MGIKVFISHASAQGDIASALCDTLESDGISCWLAPRNLRAGDNWVDAIPAGVRGADIVLVLLSDEALSPDWVDRELNMAVRSERPLMPVLLGDVEPTERFEFLFGAIQRSALPVHPTAQDLARLTNEVRILLGDDRRAKDSVSQAEPERAPRPADPFDAVVSSARPAYFVVLVDHSASMNRMIPGTTTRAREAVANVVNDVLYHLLHTSAKEDGYRHYFDVSICGYGLGASREEVRSVLPDEAERMAVQDLNERWLRLEEHPQVVTLPDGSTERVVNLQPVWMEAAPGQGRTVMAKAFEHAGNLVRSWIDEHPDSFPPVVMNISDGAWTGDDPLAAVRMLQEQATSLGTTLVFNCQLGTPDAQIREQLLYSSEIPEGYSRRTKELFWLSSVLPVSMREEARQRGFDISEDSRGLVYNAPVSRVVDFLKVGTKTRT